MPSSTALLRRPGLRTMNLVSTPSLFEETAA